MKMTNKFKTIIASTISATVLAGICVSACAVSAATSGKTNLPDTVSKSQSTQVSTNSVWRMKNCGNDKKMAEKVSGLKYAFPEYANYEIYAMQGLIEVRVKTNDNDVMTLRQSSEKGDITGVYKNYKYSSVNDSRISGVDAKLASKKGMTYAAYWTEGGCGFSLYDAKGMTTDQAVQIIAQLTGNDTAETGTVSASPAWKMKSCGNNKKMAEKVSGLKYAFPEYANYEIYAMNGLIEVRVKTNDNDVMTLRQSNEKGDITGVYKDYKYKSVNDSRISGVNAKLASKKGMTYAAYWTNGSYGFSLYNAKGMTTDQAVQVIAQLTGANK